LKTDRFVRSNRWLFPEETTPTAFSGGKDLQGIRGHYFVQVPEKGKLHTPPFLDFRMAVLFDEILALQPFQGHIMNLRMIYIHGFI